MLIENNMEIGRYRYLIPIYLGILSPIIFVILRNRIDLKKITTISFSIIIVLILISSTNLKFNESHYEDIELLNPGIDNYPDIFYIVPDEYAGDATLKTQFVFDNSKFYNMLYEKGFQVIPSSYSNYRASSLSISSTLNFDYIKSSYNEIHSPLMTVDELSDNNLFNFLRNNDYKIITASGVYISDNLKNVSENRCTKFINYDLFRHVLQSTALKSFTYEILFPLFNDHSCQFTFHNDLNLDKNDHHFVYVHYGIPHTPKMEYEDGKYFYSKEVLKYKQKNLDELEQEYLHNIKLANSEIKKLVESIISYNPNAIIIINSDHGYRDIHKTQDASNSMLVDQHAILSDYNTLMAIYSPTELVFPTEISSVNLFRTVLNQVYNQDLEILPNEYYYGCTQTGEFTRVDTTEGVINCE